jgi:hypothetical protein
MSTFQAAVIADAIEPEANLISRKDAALQQRKVGFCTKIHMFKFDGTI